MSDYGYMDVPGYGGLLFSSGPGGGATVQIEESDDEATWKTLAPCALSRPGEAMELMVPEEDGACYRLKVTTARLNGWVSYYMVLPKPGRDHGGRS